MTTILISNNPAFLASYNPTHTVEAEYGQTVVEGSVATLAHHGPRAEQPCPCLGDNMPGHSRPVIGVSHFDLDTLGGVMRFLGLKEPLEGDSEDLFWRVAALVDTIGVHKLEEIKTLLWREATAGMSMATEAFNRADYYFGCEWDAAIEALNAFWAWSEAHRLFPHREGYVTDVTDFFLEAARVASLLIEGDDNCEQTQTLYAKGKAWYKAKEALNANTYLSLVDSSVVLRVSPGPFVNHLYTTPKGELAQGIVSLNEKTRAVTLSLADPIDGVSCCEIAQRLWGPEAGGHAGIAGSPRGERVKPGEDVKACIELAKAIEAAS